MHREAIPDSVWRVLLGLSALESMRSSYLAGGTGLAIQLGHRVSVDLGFFFPEGSDHLDVLEDLPSSARGSSESQRVADRDPSRRLVASPFETPGIDEGFGKPYGMTVGIHPIEGESFVIEGEDS